MERPGRRVEGVGTEASLRHSHGHARPLPVFLPLEFRAPPPSPHSASSGSFFGLQFPFFRKLFPVPHAQGCGILLIPHAQGCGTLFIPLW